MWLYLYKCVCVFVYVRMCVGDDFSAHAHVDQKESKSGKSSIPKFEEFQTSSKIEKLNWYFYFMVDLF